MIAICVTLQHMMRNPSVYEQAHRELWDAWPILEAKPSILELERLPFLDACLKEGLRISCPAPLRMPRVVGSGGYEYGHHFLPAVVSSHYCPDISNRPTTKIRMLMTES